MPASKGINISRFVAMLLLLLLDIMMMGMLWKYRKYSQQKRQKLMAKMNKIMIICAVLIIGFLWYSWNPKTTNRDNINKGIEVSWFYGSILDLVFLILVLVFGNIHVLIAPFLWIFPYIFFLAFLLSFVIKIAFLVGEKKNKEMFELHFLQSQQQHPSLEEYSVE